MTKFRELTLTSGAHIVLGKDSKSNDELMKKFQGKENLVFHTIAPGSPFCISGAVKIDKKDIKEAAVICAAKSQDYRDNKKSVKLHLFKAKDAYKSKNLKQGTWSIRGKPKTIKAKKRDIQEFLKKEDKTAFIIHGAYGNPQENWFPWLKLELEKLGFRVFVPKFPTPTNQSLKNWLKVFNKYKKFLNRESILIGHSLGPSFILSVLEKNNFPVKSAFFVSGFIGLLENPSFDKINKTIAGRNFNWKKIKTNCKNFYMFHSDNDEYLPLEKAKELSGNLNCKLNIIKGAGHFSEKSGYKKFEILLNKIKEELKS